MVTANELRIGNLIFWNPKLSNPNITLPAMQVEISAVLEDKISYISPGIEYRVEPFEDDLLQKETLYKSLKELEPIILTAEILEKCGFKQVDDYLSKKAYVKQEDKYFLEIDINIVDHKVLLRFEGDQKVVLPHSYKYLHELQNLYFVLTYEELEVNL